jgi:hypothetical protein
MSEEVVVRVGDLPRPATVVRREPGRVLVRYRQSGGYAEQWVAEPDVLPVEPTRRLPVGKLLAGVVLAALGLLLVLWPHGSDKPLLPSGPSPTSSATP